MNLLEQIDKILIEITNVDEKEVDNVINAGEKNFKKALKFLKIKPSFLLVTALNHSFKPFDISFYSTTDPQMQATTSVKGSIKVALTKGEIKSLKSGIPSSLKKKLKDTLIHEFVHKKQFGKDKRKLKDAEMKVSDIIDYFTSDFEIEAYARSSSYEIDQGKTNVLIMYATQVRPYNKKAWEKFLKKLYQYIDMYSVDKEVAKERVKEALEFSQIFKKKNKEM